MLRYGLVVLSSAAFLCFIPDLANASSGIVSFTPLGDLSGGTFYSAVSGISADGSVVVGDSESSAGDEPIRWSAGTGMVGFGALPGSVAAGQATGASADGSVVVGYATQGSTPGNYRAFRWTQATGMQTIGSLDADNFAMAWGVSTDGSVIVGQSDSTLGSEAFRWTSAGGMVGIGDIAGGAFSSIGEATNPDGSVVVGIGSGTSTDQVEGFRWTSAGGMQSLGDLPGGHTTTRAYAVSSAGDVVAGEGSSSNGTEAFRWTAATGMQGLGDLPGGSFVSTALSMSADGSIITGFGTNASSEKAFIWDATNGIRDLQSVLMTQYGLNLTGWTLTSAYTSADGMTFAGNGIDPQGNSEGWIATVPEPSTGAVCLILTMLIPFRARRKSTYARCLRKQGSQ